MKLQRNDAVMLSCLAFVAGMVGLSFASVPLYRIFCQATGYGGTPLRVEQASKTVGERVVTVRFDTNVDPALDWTFQPEQRSVDRKSTRLNSSHLKLSRMPSSA